MIMDFFTFETCLIESRFKISAKVAFWLRREESRIAIYPVIHRGF